MIEQKGSTMSKEMKSWSKTTSGPDGSKTVRVEQVENGFIISIDKDAKNKDGDWKYECKKYIATTNPFEDSDLPDGGEANASIGDFLKDM